MNKQNKTMNRQTQNKQTKQAKHRSQNKQMFNETEFDQKVSKIIYDIHLHTRNRYNEIIYNKWCTENEDYLLELYDLSGLDCGFDIFCNYVFDNSGL